MNRRPPGPKLQKVISGIIDLRQNSGWTRAHHHPESRTRPRKVEDTHWRCDHAGRGDYLAWLRTDNKPHRWKKSDDPRSPKTLRSTWVSLSAFFRGASIELDVPSPMKVVPTPRFEEATVEPFTQQDIEALLKVCEFCKEAKTTC